jgi:pyruvate-formate lyase-activating enzyme
VQTKNKWQVVPLSYGQLRDINQADVINEGLYRKCNTYKGGGGYDKFPNAANKRFGVGDYNLQFIVQLYGCNLDCPFCYVTREGVWSSFKIVSTNALITAFNQSPCTVFHLMGGAPALAMKYWPDLLEGLEKKGKACWVFHSDLMLTESEYDECILRAICHTRALYAVGLKGILSNTFHTNTRRPLPAKRLWRNLDRLERNEVPYYITFTNVPDNERIEFWSCYQHLYGKHRARVAQEDELVIPLINYNAMPYVDAIPWGGCHD